MSNFTKTDTGRRFHLGIQPLKRLGEPDDIGGVIAFLASDDARWISGDTIRRVIIDSLRLTRYIRNTTPIGASHISECR